MILMWHISGDTQKCAPHPVHKYRFGKSLNRSVNIGYFCKQNITNNNLSNQLKKVF